MALVESKHPKSDSSGKQMVKGMVICDCWCHQSGRREDVCTKCLSRIGERKEFLSD